jgi:hypothetical protein
LKVPINAKFNVFNQYQRVLLEVSLVPKKIPSILRSNIQNTKIAIIGSVVHSKGAVAQKNFPGNRYTLGLRIESFKAFGLKTDFVDLARYIYSSYYIPGIPINYIDSENQSLRLNYFENESLKQVIDYK